MNSTVLPETLLYLRSLMAKKFLRHKSDKTSMKNSPWEAILWFQRRNISLRIIQYETQSDWKYKFTCLWVYYISCKNTFHNDLET